MLEMQSVLLLPTLSFDKKINSINFVQVLNFAKIIAVDNL